MRIFYKGVHSKSFSELPEFRNGAWVHLNDPDAEEQKRVVESLGIQDDLILDALDPYEVPRVEHEDRVTYVFIQVPCKTETGIVNAPILLALGDGFLLTVSRESFDFLEKFFLKTNDVYTTQRTKLFIQILFSVNREYSKHVSIIGKNLRSMFANLEEAKIHDITQFVTYEKVLNDFIAALVPMQAIYQSLLTSRNLLQHETDKEMVEDLFLGIGQIVETSKAMLKHSANIREASSMVMNHELNRTMRILTVWTVMLSIPMILGSFFGMNVTLPFSESPFAFAIIVLLSLTGMATLLVTFIRQRWL